MSARPKEIDGELAWGYWLRLERTAAGTAYVDADGRAWSTIRQAFREGRLGLPPVSRTLDDDLLETVLAALVSVDRTGSVAGATFATLFDGELHRRLVVDWLVGHGLIEGTSGSHDWQPTDEGAAAMRMLWATRPHPLGAIRPGRASLDEILALGRWPRSGEEERVRTERAAAGWPAAFLRQDLAGAHGIVAVRRDARDPGVQVGRTVWNVSFRDAEDRDRLYDWLCARVDRWAEWVDLAFGTQGDGLTLRLLTLTLADPRIERRLPAPVAS